MWRSTTTTSTQSESESDSGIIIITYSLAVVTLIFACQFICRFISSPASSSSYIQQSTISSSSQQHNIRSEKEEVLISDLDLKLLMSNLDESEEDKWESVVCRKNDSLSYSVKCCKPKDGGPVKYMSTTIFNNFSCCDTLRDFYMDNCYRMEWDKTLIQHQQLQLDETNGTEVGRTIKKFPLLTPREYILAWRLWEGTDTNTNTNTTTYYCYSKECEHPLAPRQNKYVRVALFRSGWRIRKVPGKNSCQIKMLHQEDAGLNVEMAKMIFAKGIWSYVCKMDTALRNYSAIKRIQLTSTVGAITFLHKVPLSLHSANEMPDPQVSEECNNTKLPSKKFIANGLIIVGGVICLARGHTSFSAKVAMAYILSKLTKRREPSLR
ncbi:hypothetical protein QVD17_07714 [Tagetes erecta]|uniref:START domain-containing protein n=1 Tax=Tagetes erecta TaxID=13708 RepID=A0AAD8LHH6_TARER|nr:hypothetical protein QVD17_07714 [Tagetes erecta]